MVSIKDVARQAGVSSATVSRVLANKGNTSAAAREKVLAAVKETGYQPDQTARRLRMPSISTVIGMIISDVSNPHLGMLVRGAEDFAYQRQMSFILCNADSQPERQQFYLNLMQAERAAGLIIMPVNSLTDGKALDRIRAAGTAIVLLDSPLEGYDFDIVKPDDRQGAFDAVSHLLRLGYERIGIITGKQTLATGRRRLQGYYDAHHMAGITVDDQLIATGDYTRASGYARAHDLLRLPQPPRAIFVCNNSMTLGALTALHEQCKRIPEDVALVGFDDPPWAGDVCPPLTTVAQMPYDMGREALRLLMRRLEEPNAPTVSVELPTKLIIRASCGAASQLA